MREIDDEMITPARKQMKMEGVKRWVTRAWLEASPPIQDIVPRAQILGAVELGLDNAPTEDSVVKI